MKHIIIMIEDVFIGTFQQFEDCFFSFRSQLQSEREEEIIDWCRKSNYSLPKFTTPIQRREHMEELLKSLLKIRTSIYDSHMSFNPIEAAVENIDAAIKLIEIQRNIDLREELELNYPLPPY